MSLPCCVICLLDFLASRCLFGMGLSCWIEIGLVVLVVLVAWVLLVALDLNLLVDRTRHGRFGHTGGRVLTCICFSCFCLRHFGLTNNGLRDVHATRASVLLCRITASLAYYARRTSVAGLKVGPIV